ncbi:MAG: hypothetical protein MUO26_02015 [Methanotrichaceae archaeon]|nr:hypothetical protein [Methanotrichaceae archaeon]
MKTDQQSAYSGSPGLKGTSSTYTQVIVPPSRSAPNSLFVSYAPQTAVGCNIYANLPLWMQTSSSGDI